MIISHLDHFVLTVRDLDVTCDFYSRVLGMAVVTFGEGRRALTFSRQKINLHQAGGEFEPKAAQPQPGSADFCLISADPFDTVIAHLAAQNIELMGPPVQRTGATGSIRSIYFRDPDGNLIEVSEYL
jgi:catechol 2,3-dioxygenase-like lactoylglutathione lyase family enzyme